ncbi:hypothetical protein [Motilimonas eburnea]|uniref:hypothetical protein n=1 Tax=Motilimonas eburnea TaxID=1737488 RepID=UPI001E5E28FE|nr:hypothetical protein [Motilimonas eburnea]MCE2571837.1 hypothetical protein [Motilimonas eburnea]
MWELLLLLALGTIYYFAFIRDTFSFKFTQEIEDEILSDEYFLNGKTFHPKECHLIYKEELPRESIGSLRSIRRLYIFKTKSGNYIILSVNQLFDISIEEDNENQVKQFVLSRDRDRYVEVFGEPEHI